MSSVLVPFNETYTLKPLSDSNLICSGQKSCLLSRKILSTGIKDAGIERKLLAALAADAKSIQVGLN